MSDANVKDMSEMSKMTAVKQQEHDFDGGVPVMFTSRIPDENSVAQMPHHFASTKSNTDENFYFHPNNCIHNGEPSHFIARNKYNNYQFHQYRRESINSNQAFGVRNISSCPYPAPFGMIHRRPLVFDRSPLTEIPSSSHSQHLEKKNSHSISQHKTLKESMKRNREERGLSSSPPRHPLIKTAYQKENKRPKSSHEEKKLHDFDRADFSKLKILCEAIDFQLKKDKVTGCSCPRSRCIKLYCECFQSGKKCTSSCRCKKCKNTDAESGPDGDRTKAINKILSRNPQAFDKDKPQLDRGKNIGIVCRCVKSQCLKLYCDCFQSGKICGQYCMCVNCLNSEKESGAKGKRTLAAMKCLERKPGAFQKKKKEIGSGCSCKNSR